MFAWNNKAVTVNGLVKEDVETLTYLGTTVSKQRGGEKDITARLGKAFVKINRVWSSSSATKKTEIRLCKTPIRPVVMYGCETWKRTTVC